MSPEAPLRAAATSSTVNPPAGSTPHRHDAHSFWGGTVKSMGLVVGDIGTSPIHTLTVVFALSEPTADHVFGILSRRLHGLGFSAA